MWSILLMVLAGGDWPSPPISPAVYLTSFGECGVSKIRRGNNNARLSTYGEVMKGERDGAGGRRGEKEERITDIRSGGFSLVFLILRGDWR